MANKPISMHRLRQILLFLSNSFSERAISRELSISRVTISSYRSSFLSSGLDYQGLLNLSDTALEDLVSGNRKEENKPLDPRKSRVISQVGYFLTELTRVGVTRQLLWEEYRKENPDGYGYSRFCEMLSEASQVKQATMRFEHKPGEKIEVDFAGKPLHYLDSDTGELVACPVLVVVLPYSSYGYLEALRDAKLEKVVSALNNALLYFGGITSTCQSDNMKQWVIKTCRYEPVFPEVLEQWASHNGTALLASRPRKPKDKPTVENHVHIFYMRIYATLRNEVFTSLRELNVAMRKKLADHHKKDFQKKAYSRQEVFEKEEKPHLLPLPASSYELKHHAKAKVQKNYHIQMGEDKHYYSVPFRLIGTEIRLVYCTEHVEIFHNTERVAVHRRSYKKYAYTTDLNHMPFSHQAYFKQKGWEPEYYLEQARQCGPSAAAYFQKILDSKLVVHQAYQSMLGLLRLRKEYGDGRMEAACRRALQGHTYSYVTVAKILENNMDMVEENPAVEGYTPPENPTARGGDSFKNRFQDS